MQREREEFLANGEYTFSLTHTFNVIGSRMERAIAFWCARTEKKLAHIHAHAHRRSYGSHVSTHWYTHRVARIRHVRRIPPVLIANTRATFKKGLELLILYEYMPSLAYYI